MLEGLYHLIRPRTAFLYTVLYRTPYFFFDIWSIVHFFSGAVLILLLAARRVRRPFAVLFVLLVAYELLELAFIYLSIEVFRPETLPDQVTDVWVGLLGGFVAWRLRGRVAARERLRSHFEAAPAAPAIRDLAVAVAVSAAWVAFYGYRYSVEALNSRGINWWAFFWWSSGLFAMLRLFDWLRGKVSPRWLAIPATWVAFVATLLAAEYIGSVLLGITELHGGRPLIFGMIHGTLLVKLYYAVAVLLTIAIAALLPVPVHVHDEVHGPGRES